MQLAPNCWVEETRQCLGRTQDGEVLGFVPLEILTLHKVTFISLWALEYFLSIEFFLCQFL